MTREEVLETAKQCVCTDRESQYGSPEDSFYLIAKFWEGYLSAECISPNMDICIVPEDVAAMMALLKIARIATGALKDDNWIDLAGYAACGGELQTRHGVEVLEEEA